MKESRELDELENLLNEKKKHKLIDKIFESKKIDNVIQRILNVYNKIYQELFIKLDLKNEIKQGKLFTILISFIAFITITIILFFLYNFFFGINFIILNSMLGINLIFSLFRYSFFSLNLLYKIIKNKGLLVKKYLSNVFPQSELLKEKEKSEFKMVSNFSNLIFEEVNKLIQKMSKVNLNLEEEKEIASKLKKIVLMVQKEDGTIGQEIKLLEVKQEITSKLSEVEWFLKEKEAKQQDQFYIKQKNIIENLDNLMDFNIEKQKVKIR